MTKERAKRKAAQYRDWAAKRIEKQKLLVIQMEDLRTSWDFTQPILRGHHSQRKSERVHERRDNLMRAYIENEKIIERMLEKSRNLERFASTN